MRSQLKLRVDTLILGMYPSSMLTPTEAHIQQYTEALLLKHGLTKKGWTVVWDRAVARSGQCNWDKKTISFSRPNLKARGVTHTQETAIHEVAHALTPYHHHDAVWKKKYRELGGRGTRCYSDDTVLNPEHIAPRWEGVCPQGHKFTRHRLANKFRNHGNCGTCSQKGLHSRIFWADTQAKPVGRPLRSLSVTAAEVRAWNVDQLK